MSLQKLKSLTLVLAFLSLGACSGSSTTADTAADGALTATEEAQLDSAAKSITQSLVTSTSDLAGGSLGFQASTTCSPYSTESDGIITETDLSDNSYRIVYDNYTLDFSFCSELDSENNLVCFEDCDEASITSFSFASDGEVEISETIISDTEGTFDFNYNSFTMTGTFGDESFSCAMDGSMSGSYSATEVEATYEDFSTSVTSGEDSVDMTADGSLTYNLVSETINGTLTFTLNGDSVTCTFVDYTTGSSTDSLCEIGSDT